MTAPCYPPHTKDKTNRNSPSPSLFLMCWWNDMEILSPDWFCVPSLLTDKEMFQDRWKRSWLWERCVSTISGNKIVEWVSGQPAQRARVSVSGPLIAPVDT